MSSTRGRLAIGTAQHPGRWPPRSTSSVVNTEAEPPTYAGVAAGGGSKSPVAPAPQPPLPISMHALSPFTVLIDLQIVKRMPPEMTGLN
jgi:hypothetical protein